MAKNTKRVSINAIDKIAGENFTNTTTEQWFDVEVTIKRSISLTEMLEFVADVTASCFDKNGVFIPEIIDFAIKSNVILKYTNISLSDNLEHRYALIYETDMMNFIFEHINMNQLQEIVGSINRKVEHLCNTNAMEIERKMNDLMSAFDNVQKQMEETFSGVSQDDITNMVGAIASGTVSEDKVVQAYISNMKREMQGNDAGNTDSGGDIK